jgi:hypothetical protein
VTEISRPAADPNTSLFFARFRLFLDRCPLLLATTFTLHQIPTPLLRPLLISSPTLSSSSQPPILSRPPFPPFPPSSPPLANGPPSRKSTSTASSSAGATSSSACTSQASSRTSSSKRRSSPSSRRHQSPTRHSPSRRRRSLRGIVEVHGTERRSSKRAWTKGQKGLIWPFFSASVLLWFCYSSVVASDQPSRV